MPYADRYLLSLVGQAIPDADAYLFGRRTYEIMAGTGRTLPRDDMFAATLNNRPKYVASTTLQEPLAWRHSTLLKGSVPEAVAALKDEPGGNIAVLGSGGLLRTLIEHDLVDVYTVDGRVHGGWWCRCCWAAANASSRRREASARFGSSTPRPRAPASSMAPTATQGGTG